jgi:hypothetical protein
MAETKLILTHDGSDKNPFGGESRVDRINLMEFMQPNAPPEKVLYLRIIQDAVSNYLYAFLGKNGTSAEEFFAAWQYFFKVKSTNRTSWDHNRTIKKLYTNLGQHIIESHYLTDSELQMMCFDKHYDFSGLAELMFIDNFRARLKEKRQRILNDNWMQVIGYVNTLYQNELSQIANGQQIPLQVWDEDLLTILTDPKNPLHLASTIYVPNKLKRIRKPRNRKIVSIGIYHNLAEKLITNNFPPLEEDWGPLSMISEGT